MGDKQIEKPLSLVISDTKNSIISIISESRLPIYIIEPIMKSLTMELTNNLLMIEATERIKYKNELAQHTINEGNESQESTLNK